MIAKEIYELNCFYLDEYNKREWFGVELEQPVKTKKEAISQAKRIIKQENYMCDIFTAGYYINGTCYKNGEYKLFNHIICLTE
jgi:hypothetical protein